MDRRSIRNELGGKVGLAQSGFGPAQLQIGERKAEMRFPVSRTKFESGLKILDGAAGLTQIVTREAPIHECGGVVSVNLDRTRVSLFRFPWVAGVGVNVALN